MSTLHLVLDNQEWRQPVVVMHKEQSTITIISALENAKNVKSVVLNIELYTLK